MIWDGMGTFLGTAARDRDSFTVSLSFGYHYHHPSFSNLVKTNIYDRIPPKLMAFLSTSADLVFGGISNTFTC